jgi:hypothetical protein
MAETTETRANDLNRITSPSVAQHWLSVAQQRMERGNLGILFLPTFLFFPTLDLFSS